jgi:hypothetical protein
VGGYNGEHGNIYTSTDGGDTWAAGLTDAAHSWRDIASSADGSFLLACAGYSFLHTSADGGLTWVAHASAGDRDWTGVAVSADGGTLVAVSGQQQQAGDVEEGGGNIYVSKDSGGSWTPTSIARAWNAVAASADGTRLVALLFGCECLYTSSDTGATWAARAETEHWQAVATSADGRMLAAAVRYGYIYTSSDYGVTWIMRDAARSASLRNSTLSIR